MKKYKCSFIFKSTFYISKQIVAIFLISIVFQFSDGFRKTTYQNPERIFKYLIYVKNYRMLKGKFVIVWKSRCQNSSTLFSWKCCSQIGNTCVASLPFICKNIKMFFYLSLQCQLLCKISKALPLPLLKKWGSWSWIYYIIISTWGLCKNFVLISF